jgi:glycosyltransferase involved in cell wall biosynthesis
MRILIVSDLWLPFPGGAERYIANVADELANRGHNIHILTSYAKAKSWIPMAIENIGVQNRHVEGSRIIFDWIQKTNPQIIITHHFFAGEFPEIFNSPVPVVEIVHSRQRNENAKLAVFNSRYTAGRCGYRDGDMVILPPVGEDTVMTVRQFAHAEADCIGHIKPLPNRYWNGAWFGKGIDMTYKLARAMPERKFLVLRGEWQDCEYIVKLPNVEFMEPVKDIREFYARCRLVLMPSASEDAGTVPQECAANGIPCISSDVGGLPETNRGGITIPFDEPERWIAEVCKLDHPEHYREIVRQQRAYIDGIGWDKQFDELDRKLRTLCD